MLERGKMDRNVIEMVEIDGLVPEGHLLRKIDKAVDFNRLYEMVEPLYCEDNGRPSVDPVVLFKMVLIQHLYGLPSLRRTAEEVSGNIYYRWFLGYTLQEETPHFSTVSYNFRHRFTEETVGKLIKYLVKRLQILRRMGDIGLEELLLVLKNCDFCRSAARVDDQDLHILSPRFAFYCSIQ